MRLNRDKRRLVPELNTSSLPDLIFSVLFFFMLVTHMRQADLKIKVETPNGTELQQNKKKHDVVNLYVGTDINGITQIQINNRLVPLNQVTNVICAEREKLSDEEQEFFTVSIKADRDTPMGVIADIKEALREANALQISYSANESKQDGINKKK